MGAGRPFSRRISCIWIQITSEPSDPIAKSEYPVGSRIMLNKKKAPYLFKYGYLRFKTEKGECKLYSNEIDMINEKLFDKDRQKNIKK